MSQRVGLVLAGGSSRRLGRAKGELLYRGQSLAERAANALWPLCSSVLISIGRGADNPAPGFATVEDELSPGRGPLAGIDAGLKVTGDADLLILACDYPLVDTELLRRVAEAPAPENDVVIISDCRGRDHPLVALWRRRAASTVTEALAKDCLKVRALLADLSVRRIGPEQIPGVDLDRLLFNLNWPGELEELSAIESAPRPRGPEAIGESHD
jgi:molybdopterin-guanine dinucleotide biosynthesis protein A